MCRTGHHMLSSCYASWKPEIHCACQNLLAAQSSTFWSQQTSESSPAAEVSEPALPSTPTLARALEREHLQHPALPCRAEEQENWAAGTPHQCKITGVQPSSNPHRNDGAVLVRARLGCDSATFSLKKRRWSLELAVAVDQQTESTKSRTHIRVRIITGTSRNPRTI